MANSTHHTAHLPDGIDIFYTDSGAPPSSIDYTTVVVLHGSAFTGRSFEKLHGYAHGMNLRTVIWNRRDYAGSTRYTDAELSDLRKGREIFLDRLAVQLGQFLEQFIERVGVPKISGDHKSGGFAIMGWSMGVASAMPLFSKRHLIPYDLLESYVKDLIIYDPPYYTFGYFLPAEADSTVIYNPWANPDNKPVGELFQSFKTWVSSYYDQPNRPSSVNELDFAKRTDHTTVESLDPEELEGQYDEAAAVRSELPMYIPPMSHTLGVLTNRVLFDEELTQTLFPKVPVSYIVAPKSNWHCYWGGIEARRNFEEHQARGKKIRPTIFFTIEGGNHFAHWDMPNIFMKTIAEGIHGPVPGVRE